MKKITLLLTFLIGSYAINAQSDCASSAVITDGTYTVSSVDGTAPTTNCENYNPTTYPPNAGVWYIYTNSGTQDLLVTITTDLPANVGGDTKVSVLSGTCSTLSCYSNNDDVNFDANNYLSTTDFLAMAGESYYVVFDATWSDEGFDFQVSSSSDLPEVPLAAINPDPADTSTIYLSEGTNAAGETVNQYVFTWDLPSTSDDATSYIFDLGIDANVQEFSTTTSGPSLTLNGLQFSTTYFWRVTSVNSVGNTVGSVWSFSTESTTLSNNSFENVKVLEYFISDDALTINAQQKVNQVEIFNMVGQAVYKVQPNTDSAIMNLGNISSGMYIAIVSFEGNTQTFKFVK